MSRPNQNELATFLTTIHGQSPGLIAVFVLPGRVADFCTAGELGSSAADLADIAETQQVYVGCATLARRPPKGRGQASDVLSIPGVWADIDLDTGCHGTSADGLPLPDADTALRVLRDVGLAPSVVVHSGGGLQVWWLFDEPLVISTERDRQKATTLSGSFGVSLVELGRRRGVHVDDVSDLPRILRPAGTLNHKRGRTPVRLLQCDAGRRYRPSDIARASIYPPAAPPTEDRRPRTEPGGYRGTSPADAFCRAATWADILEPHGWHFVGMQGDDQHWRHRTASNPLSAVAHEDPPVLVNFSSNSGLPVGGGRRLTKFRVWALLNFDGDESAAARHILERARATA